MNKKEMRRARAMLTRALENHERCGPGTYGRRDAVQRHIPDAVEAMIVAALLPPEKEER